MQKFQRMPKVHRKPPRKKQPQQSLTARYQSPTPSSFDGDHMTPEKVLYLQRTIGNSATHKLLTKNTTQDPVIQRDDVMSFQDALSFWKQLDAEAAAKNKAEEPEAKTGVGSYHEKENKEDWNNPDSAESMGGGMFKGKGLAGYGRGDKAVDFNTDEKAHHVKGTGMANATWGGNLPVKYIDDETERESYELKLDKEKNLFFWRGTPVDTSSMKRETAIDAKSRGSAKVVFVMTPSGKVYIADEGAETRSSLENDKQQWRFNHSTFLAGEPVASAGEMWFEDGKLKGISDQSGHYQPSHEHTVQILRHFRSLGVDISEVELQLTGEEESINAEQFVLGEDEKDLPEFSTEILAQIKEAAAGIINDSDPDYEEIADAFETIYKEARDLSFPLIEMVFPRQDPKEILAQIFYKGGKEKSFWGERQDNPVYFTEAKNFFDLANEIIPNFVSEEKYEKYILDSDEDEDIYGSMSPYGSNMNMFDF